MMKAGLLILFVLVLIRSSFAEAKGKQVWPLKKTTCSLKDFAGAWAFTDNGPVVNGDPTSHVYDVGRFVFDGKGIMKQGSWIATIYSGGLTGGPISGNITVHSNCSITTNVQTKLGGFSQTGLPRLGKQVADLMSLTPNALISAQIIRAPASCKNFHANMFTVGAIPSIGTFVDFATFSSTTKNSTITYLGNPSPSYAKSVTVPFLLNSSDCALTYTVPNFESGFIGSIHNQGAFVLETNLATPLVNMFWFS